MTPDECWGCDAPAVMLLTPEDPTDPWPTCQSCLDDLEARLNHARGIYPLDEVLKAML